MKYWKQEIENQVIAFGTAADDIIDEDCTEITELEYTALSNEQQQKDEYAKIYDETIVSYADQIKAGTITIEDVPADYREAVMILLIPTVEERITALEETVAEATNYEAIIHEVANA